MKARPLSEWHEEIGDALWWKFPIDEPPYIGTPLDCGFPVKITLNDRHGERGSATAHVGGWPGYHTHFTPIELPEEPA